MPLQKIAFKPGVNRENTRYTTEGGWYSCDKVRFRQGNPEKIGGWQRISQNTFNGVCRSLFTWTTITQASILTGVGTNSKFYIEQGGGYNDITPINHYNALSGPFSATAGSNVVTVTAGAYVPSVGDFVTFSGAVALSQQAFTQASATDFTLTTALPNNTPVQLSTSAGGALPTGLVAGVTYFIRVVSGTTVSFANVPDGAAVSTTYPSGSGTFYLSLTTGITASVLNQNFEVKTASAGSFTIEVSTAATAYDSGNGGNPVWAAYEIPIGAVIEQPLTGWGAGPWGEGAWGVGEESTEAARIWYQQNFGQDLIYGYRNGPMYYWNANLGTTAATFTVSVASPAVVTYNFTSLPENTAVVLNTTGALPTGLTVGTVYYVLSPSGSTFNLAATPGGPAIATSGTQSGVHTITPRGIPVTSLAGANEVPTRVNSVLVSDSSRFVLAFGCTPLGDNQVDPLLVRWSSQESVVDWEPSAVTQAGGVRLSKGSKILSAVQTRQEIVVFTDAALYSMQYIGLPYVWSTQLLGDNISFAGYNTAAVASGVVYWMGVDKFYRYDGRVNTLRCDLRNHVYSDINLDQQEQFFAGTNEGFNEVWWFYCSLTGPDGTGTTANPNTVVDRYVVYNYVEDIWYYGTMQRTAWLDSGLDDYPIAATYANNIVFHELGVDDETTNTALPIEAYITSSEFDIGDGHNFGFVWRLLPDITFRGSSAASPQATMTLLPMQNSGSGYNSPLSVGGQPAAPVVRGATVPIEQFTGQVYIRVRGRQMSFKVASENLGVQWQLGAPRIDIRPDGRR